MNSVPSADWYECPRSLPPFASSVRETNPAATSSSPSAAPAPNAAANTIVRVILFM